MPERVLIVACGALVREVAALKRRHGWRHIEIRAIDAALHNRPAAIPECVRQTIRRYRADCDRVFVAYADCGSGGGLDRVLAEEGAERLPGAHCYEFYAGSARFAALAADEPGTFYLTDFLARHFERLVIEPLGLDRHPQLADAYFGNYRRLVYLAQTDDRRLRAAAADAARRLGLEFEVVDTGYGVLETALVSRLSGAGRDTEDPRFLA